MSPLPGKPRTVAMAIRIRRGTEADIDDMVHLSHTIWRHSLAQQIGAGVDQWSIIAPLMRAELIPIARAILVAECKGRVAGFSYRDRALVEDLWVDPPFQRAGIGTRLLRAILASIAVHSRIHNPMIVR